MTREINSCPYSTPNLSLVSISEHGSNERPSESRRTGLVNTNQTSDQSSSSRTVPSRICWRSTWVSTSGSPPLPKRELGRCVRLPALATPLSTASSTESQAAMTPATARILANQTDWKLAWANISDVSNWEANRTLSSCTCGTPIRLGQSGSSPHLNYLLKLQVSSSNQT